nr:glucose dehydrogenase [Actinomycetota bacterium]
NYGWDVFEGRGRFEDKQLGPGKLVGPIVQYSHDDGCSVTGGHVYRGANMALRGRYIYGDFCSGIVWSAEVAGGKASGLRREAFKIPQLTSFGEDSAGELFAVSGGGTISRLTP